jgi:hypothetical protein
MEVMMNSTYVRLLSRKVNELESCVQKMKEALAFYADEKNWEDTNEIYDSSGMVNYSNISVDGGEYAQKVLSYVEHIND